MLASAGYPNGVTLNALYHNDSANTHLFEAMQASLKPCGVNLAGKAEPGSSYFTDLGNSPVNNQPGKWDIGASPAGTPTGTATTAGRSFRPSSRPTVWSTRSTTGASTTRR